MGITSPLMAEYGKVYEMKKGWKVVMEAGGETPRPDLGFRQTAPPTHSVIVSGIPRVNSP